MSFGLKNVGVTYQQLMNKTLRTYRVKLNPQKCLFGAKSDRFLGYIVTERGIEANPSKVKALQDMPPPRNLRQVQRLTGRITALSRFISKTVDRSLPFFKILRRATKFQWDRECDQAFEELKVYLNSLPVLAKPNTGEPLRIYLSSTEHTVGSALVRQDGEEQLVYFLSHILKDTESRYTGLEKLAFALVLAARRLQPYFLAHMIIVMPNNPLGRYQPHTTIKAQSLADFVTEVHNPEPESLWKVFVDGSSTRLGSGIGILLISPQEERVQLSVRLDYRATNNEAEYEALIAGLQAARHVGASRVMIYSDSQLAAQQLSGTFEINNARLKLYTEAFEKLKANFSDVVIQKIPRAENQAADELAKLASSISPIVIQQSIEQVSLVARIDRMEGLTFPSNWRTDIVEFLRSGATPFDREEAQLLRKRAGRFTLIGDQLYKKAFSRPLLKCVNSEDAEYILKEVHQGSCGGHPSSRSLARKILLAGWVDELSGVLWAIRTTPKEGTGVTPFHLVYGGEVVVPVEVGIESDRVQQYDADNAGRRQLELNLIDEVQAKAAVRLLAYRQRMKQSYNRRVIPRAFQVDDLVWKKVKSVDDE
ncbi:uncharacterized protein LOC121995243 [Zingiber officinale]|uniref:uncharacterized protein LOC121995243 n=1 Tax=Zingiber officinale TaxID=94328 RepID=UPI001C4B5B67|nr:uncharacterized protein LOC121995243 [Zingiber officinale]